MISFKYGIILVIILCIYFSYKGSIIKEGFTLKNDDQVNISLVSDGVGNGMWVGLQGDDLWLYPASAISDRGKWVLNAATQGSTSVFSDIVITTGIHNDKTVGIDGGGREQSGNLDPGLVTIHPATAMLSDEAAFRLLPVDGMEDTYYIENRKSVAGAAVIDEGSFAGTYAGDDNYNALYWGAAGSGAGRGVRLIPSSLCVGTSDQLPQAEWGCKWRIVPAVAPPASCSSFDSCDKGWTLKYDKNYQCKSEGCDNTTCCDPPTCASFDSCNSGWTKKADTSISCTGGKCSNKLCCTPICSSFKCPPDKQSITPNIPCNNGVCTELQCCASNPKCESFNDCGNGQHVSSPQTTCEDSTCTADECCSPNQKCSSFRDCGSGKHVLYPDTICNDAKCTEDECCSDNPICNSFTNCGKGKKVGSPHTVCQTQECTADECCTDNPRCFSFSCDKKHTPKNPNKICDENPCSGDECCEANPTCSLFSCPGGYTNKMNAGGITCIGTPCENDECCFANQTCGYYQCHSGQSLKKNARGHVCEQLDCTNNECCGDNPKCSTHTCTSSYYITKTLLDNASDITCGGAVCNDNECCEFKPSGRLPKIKIWPIYQNSI